MSRVTVLVKIVQFGPDRMEPCKPGEPDLHNGSGGRWQPSALRAGTRERRQGGGGYVRRSVAGYSLGACSLHPVAPGDGIHSGPDLRHQEKG